MKRLHQITEPMQAEPQSDDAVDRTLVVCFKTAEDRQRWKQLADSMGHDEHALACHVLTNFTAHCRGEF